MVPDLPGTTTLPTQPIPGGHLRNISRSANQPEYLWVDMWAICDSSNCYHFSSDDNFGHLYHAQSSVANFPNGFGQLVNALSAAKNDLFEAYKYKVGSQYLLIVEYIGSTGLRYFRSWTSSNSIAGSWTALHALLNVIHLLGRTAFSSTETLRLADISHGAAVR
ncbi:hypothetical protein E1B28_007913 [Marasmius oreades]|uniref:Alpha-L-arabinofuranosidase n=1 Tax=Marasmius oreades TaxID=181124 RepID=A0A9P7S410_9AGAR|nr:uncharacterized protein E1B28_007913 [Marasmius oreades]KAG7094311.1 hypothetical protein E1B28_007913 [Marasmius oreades]